MQEELGTYNAVMTEVGQALIAAASQLLAPGNVAQLEFEGDADEFGQYLCETMALYGASHLHCVGGPDQKVLFLQQVSANVLPNHTQYQQSLQLRSLMLLNA